MPGLQVKLLGPFGVGGPAHIAQHSQQRSNQVIKGKAHMLERSSFAVWFQP